LCDDPDSLVLWSNYSNVDGYCLGFNCSIIYQFLNQERNINKKFDHYYIGKIIYDETEQTNILFEEIMRIYRILKEQQNITQENINHAIILCQMTIETYAMFYKKNVFKQEDEYRIAFIIMDQEKIKTNIKYRIGNGSLIPYLPISFHEHKELIDSVTVGPKNNNDTSVYGLMHFLKNKGYEHMRERIFKSNIPLRF
jgi:hypothetical protein